MKIWNWLFRHKETASNTKGLSITTTPGMASWNPETTPLWHNSAVMASVKWASRTFPEAPLVVDALNGDVYAQAHNHPLTQLIARPNPFYSGNLLWSATLLSLMVDGNCYWHKARNSYGVVKELHYLPHYAVTPKLDARRSYITHYEYRTSVSTTSIPVEDIVHFRDGIDPDNPFIGLSSLKSVFREILADNQIAEYSHSILKNMGVVGVIIAPKDKEVGVQDGEAERIATRFIEQYTGTGRGKAMVLDFPVDMHAPGFSPKDIAVDQLRQIPESRIAAVLGIPAVVLGLSVGLEHSTFSNMKEAREMAYESFIIPMQSLLAGELNVQLLPELGDASKERARFDNSDVRVLQEDENARAERTTKLYQGGVIKRSEARAEHGYDYTPDDEVYYSDVQFGASVESANEQVMKSVRARSKERRKAYEALDSAEEV